MRDAPIKAPLVVAGSSANWTPPWAGYFQELTVSINGIQAVVGPQSPGWESSAGTATRTAFDTTTVTTEQLAQRVKALIDDLIEHGLIGS